MPGDVRARRRAERVERRQVTHAAVAACLAVGRPPRLFILSVEAVRPAARHDDKRRREAPHKIPQLRMREVRQARAPWVRELVARDAAVQTRGVEDAAHVSLVDAPRRRGDVVDDDACRCQRVRDEEEVSSSVALPGYG